MATAKQRLEEDKKAPKKSKMPHVPYGNGKAAKKLAEKKK